jgi:hypothetical protein
LLHCLLTRSRDSLNGIATRYGLEGTEIESRWGEISFTYPDRLRGQPSLLYNGYRVFPGDKGGRCLMLTTHPLLVPRLRKSRAIPPLTLWVILGLLWGSLYPFLSANSRGSSSRPGTVYNCSGAAEFQAEPRPQYFLHVAFFPPSVAKCEFYDSTITQIIIIQFHHMILPENKLRLKATFIFLFIISPPYIPV